MQGCVLDAACVDGHVLADRLTDVLPCTGAPPEFGSCLVRLGRSPKKHTAKPYGMMLRGQPKPKP